MLGEIIKDTPLSAFHPPKEVGDFTKIVKGDYSVGHTILNTPFEELNYYSVINRMNKDQLTFNAFVDESVEDENEKWKWRGTRSMARNKAMAMHAHLTAAFIVPSVIAQNDKQEEDRDMAAVARDIVEWMTLPTNTDYRKSFLLAAMGMLVNPVTYVGAEYRYAVQKIKEKTDEGLSVNEVVDEVLSGAQFPLYSADQVMLSNAYEQNIQRQRVILKRKFTDYKELEAIYGNHPNWQYVQPGIKTIYSEEDGLFYDIKDDQNQANLCEEVIWLNRRDDGEVPFVNGIYLGDENVEANAIKHRDNRNTPKYNLVPFGYERINEHFFFYKSLMNRVGWDNALIDAMYENVMNREILDVLQPVAISGAENFDQQVVFPGSVVVFENPQAEAKPLLPARDRSAGYRALQEIERSTEGESISAVQEGALPEPSQKAFNVARAERNARIVLRGVARWFGESIVQLGQLMIDIALQHLTVAQIDEITGAESYRPFILQDQMVNGKRVSKKILFDESLVGRQFSKKEREQMALRLLTEMGYPDFKEAIYRVNPYLFSKMKYLVTIQPDEMLEKTAEARRAIAERMYATFRADPMVEPEFVVRELLDVYVGSRADEAMRIEPVEEQISKVIGKKQPAETPEAVLTGVVT